MLAARGGCWFSNDRVTLHLGVDDDFRPARKAHPALVVRRPRRPVCGRSISGARVRFDHDLPGVRRCYVDDPFGNRLELIEA